MRIRSILLGANVLAGLPAVGWAATVDMATEVSGVVVTAEAARISTVATKSDAPILETPQSIAVITADDIRDQGALTLQHALNYAGGVRSDSYGNDGRVDSFTVRGATPAQYTDGLRSTFTNIYYATARMDPYALERIDVVKGPASVLYGQGTIGGVVNMTSKRPQFTAAGELIASYGTWNRRQVQGDWTGPVAGRDDLALRITGLWRESDTQVDFIGDDRWFLAGSLTWRPTASTELTVLLRRQQDRTGSTTQFLPWEGTIFPNPNGQFRTSLFIGEPDWERYDADQTELSWFIRQDLTPWLSFRQNARAARAEVTYQTIYPNSYANPFNPFIQAGQAGYTGFKRNLARYLSGSYPDTRSFGLDNQLHARFSTGAMSHSLLAGVDYLDFKQTLDRAPARLIAPIDFYAPVYGNYTQPTAVPGGGAKQRQTGVYLQDQARIGRLTLLAGLRQDSAQSWTIAPSGVTTKMSDSAVTGRIGALYTFPGEVALYVSYAESFLPTAGTNLAGVPFEPQIGKQWEAGVKWQPRPDTLVTAAVFDLRDTNRVTTSPTDPLDRVQTGEVTVTGFEIEGVSVLAGVWELRASYSYTDAEVSKSNNLLELGKPLASVPEHLASAWAARRFELGDDQRIKVGLGVRYAGEAYDRNLAAPLFTLKTPGHTLWDAMASYERDRWRVALNVNNLADEVYFASCLTRGDCFIGARRTVIASLGYRF